MNDYGVVSAPDTVNFERLLPGPIERVWSYLIDSDKRRQWLAAGDIEQHVGGKVVHVFHNNELTEGDAAPPQGYESAGHETRMEGTVTACDAPRLLAYTWMGGCSDTNSEVRFELIPQGDKVLLRLTHTRLASPKDVLSVSGGWHTHLDLLADRLNDRHPAGFWRTFTKLEREYAHRIGTPTPPAL